jgi:hypothetical protein
MIAGTADLGFLKRFIAGTGFHPIRTNDGRGVATVSVLDYQDTNIEPYKEWFISIPVNPEQRTVPSDDPYAMFGAGIDPQNAIFGVK